DQGLRIRDLADPSKKMSKSAASDRGIIYLSDDPDTARQKVMTATTDSLNYVRYDKAQQPGVANLLELLALLKGVSTRDVIKDFEGQTVYGPLKQATAAAAAAFLEDFKNTLDAVDDKRLEVILLASEQAMAEQANRTLDAVQKAVGLR
ncbi:MAG: tryptophan--tRNA ligase, partial [Candidatus Saccharimonadales bacterium]